jgi:hypothetical protein
MRVHPWMGGIPPTIHYRRGNPYARAVSFDDIQYRKGQDRLTFGVSYEDWLQINSRKPKSNFAKLVPICGGAIAIFWLLVVLWARL